MIGVTKKLAIRGRQYAEQFAGRLYRTGERYVHARIPPKHIQCRCVITPVVDDDTP